MSFMVSPHLVILLPKTLSSVALDATLSSDDTTRGSYQRTVCPTVLKLLPSQTKVRLWPSATKHITSKAYNSIQRVFLPLMAKRCSRTGCFYNKPIIIIINKLLDVARTTISLFDCFNDSLANLIAIHNK